MHIGDRVEHTDPLFAGWVGEVTYVFADGDVVAVNFPESRFRNAIMPVDKLRLAGASMRNGG